MIRTIADVIDVSASSGELCRQTRVYHAHVVFLVKSAGHPDLIRYDKCKPARIVERSDRRFGAFNPTKLFDLPNISVIMVEDPVAIEKGCRPAPAFGNFATGPHQIIRDADIDEIAIASDTAQPSRLREARENVTFQRAGRFEAIKERSPPQ